MLTLIYRETIDPTTRLSMMAPVCDEYELKIPNIINCMLTHGDSCDVLQFAEKRDLKSGFRDQQRQRLVEIEERSKSMVASQTCDQLCDEQINHEKASSRQSSRQSHNTSGQFCQEL